MIPNIQNSHWPDDKIGPREDQLGWQWDPQCEAVWVTDALLRRKKGVKKVEGGALSSIRRSQRRLAMILLQNATPALSSVTTAQFHSL